MGTITRVNYRRIICYWIFCVCFIRDHSRLRLLLCVTPKIYHVHDWLEHASAELRRLSTPRLTTPSSSLVWKVQQSTSVHLSWSLSKQGNHNRLFRGYSNFSTAIRYIRETMSLQLSNLFGVKDKVRMNPIMLVTLSNRDIDRRNHRRRHRTRQRQARIKNSGV